MFAFIEASIIKIIIIIQTQKLETQTDTYKLETNSHVRQNGAAAFKTLNTSNRRQVASAVFGALRTHLQVAVNSLAAASWTNCDQGRADWPEPISKDLQKSVNKRHHESLKNPSEIVWSISGWL